MRTTTALSLAAASLSVLSTFPAAAASAQVRPSGLELSLLGRYSAGAVGAGAAEITAYDAKTRRVFVINAERGTVDVLDLRDPRSPRKVATLATPGANSVAVHDGLVAVAQQAADKTAAGSVAFFRASTGEKLRQVTVGALPDMLTFTEDGRKVVVANEGEAASYCAGDVNDPEGSVSVVDVRTGAVRTARFTAWNGKERQLRAEGVRISGPGVSVAQDLEPEYITTEKGTAWVTLQENNALAVVDLDRAAVRDIVPLGLKDHAKPANAFDASDKDDKIDIRPHPVKGVYMPDAVDHFRSRGRTYLVTANEGDSREWECHADEVRVKDAELSPAAFPDAARLKQDSELGRLTVLADSPKDAQGRYTGLRVFGGRSISVRATDGSLVWDSGSRLEQLIARELPGQFNFDNEENDSFDSRSDNKGPEPEGVTVGTVRGRPYAFVGLERVGGVAVFDLSDPRDPREAGYVNTRDFTGDVEAGTAGDVGPEGVLFIDAHDSPTRTPLLVVGNEISGTTAVYEINP
ncbi:alkaline phosphatase [Nonomuraea terrae]|uniref:Alkaline phosphatase n=1 Tax=Nonomuraea terrae TaxID=2530383 RepID=A0A4V2YIW3_9ACTN|nr:choice-of-anchor I family protein [Nonomuraea terrae]TDD36437.1 alkaline phosphatase [Nonomuraea terrae]